MKKRISFFAIAMVACALMLTACFVIPTPNPAGNQGFSIIRAAGDTNTMLSVREAYYQKSGSMVNVFTDDTDKGEHEIVMGETSREITDYAEGLLKKNHSYGSFDDPAGFIICEKDGSVAVWWSDDYIEELAIKYFIDEYVSKTGFEFSEGFVYTDAFSLSAYKKSCEAEIEDGYYEKIAAGLGQDAADALRNLYSLYDERLYKWEASLYDPGIGGYYFSNSALENEGYLPDLESTVQALRFIAQSGMMNNYGGSVDDLYKVLTPEIVEGFVEFAHFCQSSDDGYYYHPQWGTAVSDLRLGRDLGWGVSLLKMFGEKPLYDTPSGVKGSLGEPGVSASNVLTDRLGGSSVVAASKIVSVAAVADRFSTEEKFIAYFNSFNWADPTPGSKEGSSYHAGSTLSGQTSQIKAAGLGDLCIRLFDEMQERVQENLRAAGRPENGLWDPENSYDAINGVMKITSIYNDLGAKIKYAEPMMECVIEMITHTGPDFDETEPTGAITVYNPWVSAAALISNMNKHGDSAEAASFRQIIRDNAADMVNVTAQKILPFRRDDGSYGIYSSGKAPANQYGAPIAVKDTVEGDINGAGLSSTGLLGRVCATLKLSEYIGLETLPMYYESDLDVYLDIMLNASPVVKNEIVLVDDPVTFEGDSIGTADSEIAGINITANNGSFTVEEDPTDPDNNALKLITTPSGVGGDTVAVNTANQKDTTPCYGFEWRMYVDEIVGTPKIPFQIKLGDCFMLELKYENGLLELYAATGTSSGYQEEKLGVSVKLDEWHTYRIEYYKMDGGAKTKIYLDGNLRAESELYFGQHNGKASSSSYGKGSIFVTKTCELTVYYDDIIVEKLDQSYREEALVSPDRIKGFDDLADGALYDGMTDSAGIASVAEDPYENDKALLLSGSGTVAVSTSATASEYNCLILETSIYVESGSGEIGRLLLAEDASVPVVGYALIVDGEYVSIVEVSKDGANNDVLGETVGEFYTKEWTDIRIEYYRYQKKAIINVDGEETVSEVYYRAANLGADYMQLAVVMKGGSIYFDDLLAERAMKLYVEDGEEIEDTDMTFPAGQDPVDTPKNSGFDGTFDFESAEIGSAAIPGTYVRPNGEVGNSITVENDPEDGDNKVLTISTEYSNSKGNSLKFLAGSASGSLYVFECDIFFEFVGNSVGSRTNELSLKSGDATGNGTNIFAFAFNYNGSDGMSIVAKDKASDVLAEGISLGEWHRLRIVFDNSTCTATVYIDGVTCGTSAAYGQNGPFSFVSLLANQRTNEIIHIDNVKVDCE